MYRWGQAVALLALVSLTHSSTSRTQLVLFGDSLTDNGNAYNLTNGRAPAPLLYWNGRFSDGPNWVDFVADALPEVDVTNFAYGGATACSYPSWPMLTLQTEYILYRTKVASNQQFAAQLASNERIGVIWIGHNDLVFLATILAQSGVVGAIEAAQRVGSCIANTTHQLMSDGFKSVIIGTLSAMTYSPFAATNQTTELAKVAVTAINIVLKQAVAALSSRYNGSVLLWDAGADSVRWFTTWQAEGFTYNGSCITFASGEGILAGGQPTSVCSDPAQWLFHDPVHFSSKLHSIVASSFLSRLVALKIVPPVLPSPSGLNATLDTKPLGANSSSTPPAYPPLNPPPPSPPHPKPPAPWRFKPPMPSGWKPKPPKPPGWKPKPKSPGVVVTTRTWPPSPKRKSPPSPKPPATTTSPPRPKPTTGRKAPPPT